MKKTTSRKRYNTYSLITLIVIILSFGYYYFFYIPQQESLFHKKGFRIIEKTGENVELQYDNYKEIINDEAKFKSRGLPSLIETVYKLVRK